MTEHKKTRGFRERRQAVKEATQEALNTYNAKESKFAMKDAYKEAKETQKAEKKLYKLVKKRKQHYGLKVSPKDKEAWKRAKQDKRIAKKVYVKTAEKSGGTVGQKFRRGTYRASKQLVRSNLENAASQDETLGAVAEGRRKIRNFHYQKDSAKSAVKAGGNLGKWTIQKSYGLTNRGYNFVRGRGFTRTPFQESWQGKLAKRYRNFTVRFKASKTGKVTRGAGRGIDLLTKPLRTVLHNPLSAKSYIIMFLAAVIVALVGVLGGSSTVSQDEFKLNQAWLYFSQLDRENSNSRVDYWSDIDSVMTYMNYRYGDYDLKGKWDDGINSNQAGADHNKTYENALTSLWNGMNQETDHLKTMKDLYSKKSKIAWAILPKDDREDYEELLESAQTDGYYTYLQELDNPFYTDKDEAHYNSPLRIIKRFGYTSKSKIYQGSVLQANTGQQLLAVMSGTVKVSGADVTIETKESKFTYKDVSGIRFKTGDTVEQGTFIGTVKSSTGQEVYYQKQEEKATKKQKAKWTYVNVGFYFQLVNYTQTTSVLTDLNLSGDLAQRSRAVRDFIKKKIPNATDNGIAAMLGNFATESGIKAKRAESDYLSPPVGATEQSWDDENWLNMGFAQGASVGPLVIHRGLGLGMWTDTSDGAIRNTLLRNYAKTKGKKWYDLETQIDFMLEGDNPYYIRILKSILTSSENVNTLTTRFLSQWEGNAGDKLAQRQNNAKQMLTYFKQTIKGSGTEASSWNFPSGWESKLAFGKPSTTSMTTQPGNNYPVGQCTWYVANRLVETGTVGNALSSNNGNGQDWVRNLVAKGWRFSTTPTPGAVCSTAGGFDLTTVAYGHVAFVEAVNHDGTFLISECNYLGVQDKVHYRVLSNQAYYTFATPK